jgi:hypothetical protein
MLSDIEFQELVEDLSNADVSIRVDTLKSLSKEPAEDERVLPYLDNLLEDEALCVVMLPYRFGEVRWLAAKVLVAERAALGHNEPVHLSNVVRPVDVEEFASLAKSAGVTSRGGVDGVLEALAILREMQRLPLYDLELIANSKINQDAKINDLKSISDESDNQVTDKQVTVDTINNVRS